MTNHVHLLLTPEREDSIGRLMQYLGRYYVLYINHQYGRSGTLWEGRYKASLVQEEGYLLACHRYIELNPVRADMVKDPEQYRWSSNGHNALGQADALITPHSLYCGLGCSGSERQSAYQGLFQAYADEDKMAAIRDAWRTGTPLGNDRFKAEVEGVLGRKVGEAKRGRPRKGSDKGL